jgi:hypothetical protein
MVGLGSVTWTVECGTRVSFFIFYFCHVSIAPVYQYDATVASEKASQFSK